MRPPGQVLWRALDGKVGQPRIARHGALIAGHGLLLAALGLEQLSAHQLLAAGPRSALGLDEILVVLPLGKRGGAGLALEHRQLAFRQPHADEAEHPAHLVGDLA